MILTLWLIITAGLIFILLLRAPSVSSQIMQWQRPLVVVQLVVGCTLAFSLGGWLRKEEESAINAAILGFLLSLVLLQTVYFYLSQFSAITVTLIQLLILQFLLAYRRWYL